MNKLSEMLVTKFGTQILQILVVDVDQESRQQVKLCLQAEGFEVITASSDAEVRQTVRKIGIPNLVIFDPALSNDGGAALVTELQKREDVPFIFISAVINSETVVTTLNRYAEDYVIKPFHPSELVARVKRVLLRTAPALPRDPEQTVDDYLRVNFAQQYAVVDGQSVPLTPTENRIIHALYTHRGRVLSPGFLLVNAWDNRNRGTLESLWVHIRRLRSKIEPNPNQPTYVMTVRGRGYCLPHTNQRGQQADNNGRVQEMAHA